MTHERLEHLLQAWALSAGIACVMICLGAAIPWDGPGAPAWALTVTKLLEENKEALVPHFSLRDGSVPAIRANGESLHTGTSNEKTSSPSAR